MDTPKYSYISLISSNTYIEGVLVLYHSLIRTNPRYPFLLLITPNISQEVIKTISGFGIDYSILEQNIRNPINNDEDDRRSLNYTKLHIFNQTQFDKIVYLDADMLVVDNIDELFDKPHMSAVNSGGMLPEHADWIYMNSGLLVVVPSQGLFNDMLSKVGKIELRKSGGGDQEFLKPYFAEWPYQNELHLDHGYNMVCGHMDRYKELFGYDLDSEHKPIKVLHFTGPVKPWHMKKEIAGTFPIKTKRVLKRIRNVVLSRKDPYELRDRAMKLWLEYYTAGGPVHTGLL